MLAFGVGANQNRGGASCYSRRLRELPKGQRHIAALEHLCELFLLAVDLIPAMQSPYSLPQNLVRGGIHHIQPQLPSFRMVDDCAM